MSVTTEIVRFGDEPTVGYLCHRTRQGTTSPAVIVLQEAWGVDAHIEDVTRRFADAGYVAVAPDLFARNGERPAALARERLHETRTFIEGAPPAVWSDPAVRAAELGKLREAEGARIGETLGAIGASVSDLASKVPAALACARWLRTECELTRGQKVGAVGFCMGGGVSALLAANDPELAAAIVFYGSSPPADLVARIACPVLGLYGGLDARVNGGVPAFEAAMKQHGKRFTAVTYEGAQHAFFNDQRKVFHPDAARDAFARALDFFRVALAPS